MATLLHKHGEFWTNQQVRYGNNSNISPEVWHYDDNYPDFLSWVNADTGRCAQWQHAKQERAEWFSNAPVQARKQISPGAVLFMEWAALAGAETGWVNQLDW
jgi:hypothetical protein